MRPLCHVDMTAWSFSNREDSKFSHCQKENQYVDSDRIAILNKEGMGAFVSQYTQRTVESQLVKHTVKHL